VSVIVIQFVTLDGVVSDPDGTEGSPGGGWAFRHGPEAVAGDKFRLGERLDTGTLLLGRRTWQLFSRLFPLRADPFSTAMNRAPKAVAARTPFDVAAWSNSTLLDGDVQVLFVRAHHGSGVAADDRSGSRHGGAPGGFVISIRGGPAIYHTGDTDLFSDMALVSRFHKIDVMLVCIGDHYTMGPARAAEAVRLVNPREVIPMHYGTFPLLTGTPEAFERELKQRKLKTQLRVMKIGETTALL